MQIGKSNIYYIINRFLFWLMLNFSLNLFGLWFSKLLLKEEFVFPESIKNEFVLPILIQSLVFGICFGIAYLFLKNRKISWIAFGAFQAVVLHIAFFTGLKFTGGLHFETTISQWGLRLLSYNGQYLLDFIFINKPLTGVFDNGIFKPDSTAFFYLQWVFSVIIYFTGISWLNEKIADFFSSIKTQAENSEVTINDI